MRIIKFSAGSKGAMKEKASSGGVREALPERRCERLLWLTHVDNGNGHSRYMAQCWSFTKGNIKWNYGNCSWSQLHGQRILGDFDMLSSCPVVFRLGILLSL